jgi:hypothetical protein
LHEDQFHSRISSVGLLSCFGVSDRVNPHHFTPRRPPLIIINNVARSPCTDDEI